MEDPCGDCARNVEITAEHAVLIPALPSVKNVMAYVEAVAVVIGSCHIHSVYEAEENVKIYLNDKRFVDILVNNGVSILGRQMNVDYAAPRADKLTLSNVDPIVPDAALMKLLSYYGQPVSSIIHEKVATNCEYSHIECGKRRVYMKMFADKDIPTHINFTFQEHVYHMDIVVDNWDKNSPCEPAAAVRTEEQLNDEQLEVGSNQSLKPNIQELMEMNPKQLTPKQLAYRNRGEQSPSDSAKDAARKIKRRARGAGWLSNRLTRMKSNLNGVKANPTGKAKRLVVKKVATARRGVKRRGHHFSRPKGGRPASNRTISTPEINPEPFDVIEINSDEVMEQSSSPVTEQTDMQSISQYPLSFEELQKFVLQTRFIRDPMQVAVEFLADNNTPEAVNALKSQLQEYFNVCKEQSLKFRIKRLISAIKNTSEVIE